MSVAATVGAWVGVHVGGLIGVDASASGERSIWAVAPVVPPSGFTACELSQAAATANIARRGRMAVRYSNARAE
jgi:hypothetical protein